MPKWNSGSVTTRTPVSDDYRIAALQNEEEATQHWVPGVTITYSFPTRSSQFDGGRSYGSGEIATDWQPLTTAQQESVRWALNTWAKVANIKFEEVSEGGSSGMNVGELRFAFTKDMQPDAVAHAYLPQNESALAGDIWLTWDWRYDRLAPLQIHTAASRYDSDEYFAYGTLIHEIGHALGLRHPFEEAGRERATDPLPWYEDHVSNSIMSYDWTDWLGGLTPAITPMPYDILAIQYLYGANTSYEARDTLWSSDIGTAAVQTIWDAGGIDTWKVINTHNAPFPDLENSQWSLIDLKEGAGSSIGFVNKTVYDMTEVVDGQTVRPYGFSPNVFLAYGTVIENAIGSAGPDIIYGNAHNNRLEGGGDGRQDQIDGREGRDTAVYSALHSDYEIKPATPPTDPTDPWLDDIEARKEYTVTRKGTDAALSQDWLVNIERLEFSDRSVALDFDAGEAGSVAVGLVTALLGRQSLSNAALMGEVIHYADHMDAQSMARILVDAGITASLAGGNSDSDLIRLLYRNVTGQTPSAANLKGTVAYAQDNDYSQADILSVIAGIPQTFARADLVGLQQQGLTFIEFA